VARQERSRGRSTDDQATPWVITVPVRRKTEVAPLLDRMRAELSASWPLTRMAEECRMSLRTFVRRFTETSAVVLASAPANIGPALALPRQHEARCPFRPLTSTLHRRPADWVGSGTDGTKREILTSEAASVPVEPSSSWLLH
jgi:hypothetical protein